MNWPTGLEKNFRLLVVEVIKQIQRTQRLLERPNERLLWQIRRRDDYVDHLKHLIENKCYTYLRHHGNIEKLHADRIRSINVMTTNLERVADKAVNIVRQTTHFSAPSFLNRYDYRPFFDEIITALDKVYSAAREQNSTLAVEICEAEAALDRLYARQFERILSEMAASEEAPDLVTSLFIFHYLERMGDGLLNVGEAILFSKVGERLKFTEYRSLDGALAAASPDNRRLEEMDVEGIWGTRSGCRIGKVSDPDDTLESDPEMIYKEGERLKIRQEKEKIDQWNRLIPGLAPTIVEYQEEDELATLLLEYLRGSTLQEIVVDADDERLEQAIMDVQHAVREIWQRTKKPAVSRPGFLGQLTERIEDVYVVHPDFKGTDKHIDSLVIPDFPELVARNEHLDEELTAPFSVFGHGDFNVDNVIFNAAQRKVHFIDLHRSGDMDYVADIAVFLVSNFRLPFFEARIRSRLGRVMDSFYDFARDFAREHGDETFDARLTLGLVRSFATSTRFEVDRVFAEHMLLRATYLLERLERHKGKPWMDFALPREALDE
jgi:phosphate uptake regulator/aminoglycoside phosphotransferase (APT) family kinase protein